MKIGFLGLGIMGAGMAHRLAAAGFELTVYNRDKAKAASFQGVARIADTPAQAVEGADIAIAMLSDDKASRALWLDGGVLAALKPGTILIECSTLSLGWGRELAAAAAARGCVLLDAPVAGTKPHAAEGSLRFFVGGDDAALDHARPVFAAMGTEVNHIGPAGSGIMMKLVNNFLCGVQVAAYAEAMALASKSGLDMDVVRGVLLNGAPASPLVKTVAARMQARDYAPNFYGGLMAKDLGYAADEAKALGLTLDSAAAARKRFLDAVAAGHGEDDMASVIEPLLA